MPRAEAKSPSLWGERWSVPYVRSVACEPVGERGRGNTVLERSPVQRG